MSQEHLQVKVTQPLPEDAIAVFRQHGCVVDETTWLVMFPIGTTRAVHGLHTVTERYKLTLPDGFVMYERYDRHNEERMVLYPAESS